MPSLCSGHPGRFYLSFVPSAQKKMIFDIDATKKLKADYKKGFEEYKQAYEVLKASKASDEVTLNMYKADFVRRCQVHATEWELCLNDCRNSFNAARRLTVELFPIK